MSRLSLNGFKSFVDPTELPLADGLTGVVGPNGCGKSNLLEALRWVMGETRASAVRGGAMADVIFAGAASRAPRPWAEVALTFDRAGAGASGGADGTEVVRRVRRDGTSSYKVDGRDALARDVALLFADAATGAQSPALVRQGEVAELVAAKPRARRRVLEAAAGIAGLHGRRHDAELRLSATDANLARVSDAVDALDARAATLERQARQARRYRETALSLRSAEAALLLRRKREAEAAQDGAEAAVRAAAAAERRAADDAERSSTARAAAEADVASLREALTVAGALRDRAADARAALAVRLDEAAVALGAAEARLERLDADIAREEGLDREAAEAVAQLAREAEALADGGAAHADRLAAAKLAAERIGADLVVNEAALARETEAVASLAARHDAADRAVAEAVARHDRASEAARRTAGSLDAAARDRDAAEAEAHAARDATGPAATVVDAATRRLRAADAARASAEAAAETAHATAVDRRSRAAALGAEVEIIEGLLDAERGEDGASMLNRIRVDPGYEAALAAAVGDALRFGEARDGGGEGWVTLAGPGEENGGPAGAEPLATHVEAPAALRLALGAVRIVDADEGHASQGMLRPGEALVSREGALWRWDGLRVAAGGMPSATAARLERANRLARLRPARDRACAAAKAAAEASAAARAALAAARAEAEAARRGRGEADRAAAETERRSSRSAIDAERAAGALSTLRRAKEAADRDAAAAKDAAEAARARAEALPPIAEARDGLASRRIAAEAARADAVSARTEAATLAGEAGARSERLEAVRRDRDRWQARLDGTADRRADLGRRRDEGSADLRSARERPKALRAEAATLAAAAAEAAARAEAASEAARAGEARLRDAVTAERAAAAAVSEHRVALARVEARAEAAALAASEASARLAAASPLPDGAEQDGRDAAALEAEIERLRRARDAMGAVNLRAEDDLSALQAERDALAGERDDLAAAVASLRAGIAALNREGRQRLLDAFERVDADFRSLFRHLFDGGEARLALVESDDPLEAGLEILCQPPGKRLSSLSLLSGGEQTLTALALIFAVFLSNPAPVCVLDEVDAPLDDANVGRFCDMLDAMAGRTRTRFLVITHHAVTMARMDRLFGVTMAEPGVSQLVSVDLRRAEAMVG